MARSGLSKLRPAFVANISSEPPPTNHRAPRRETVGAAGRGETRSSRSSRIARRLRSAIGVFSTACATNAAKKTQAP